MKKVKHQAMRILGLVASIIILVVLLPILGGCTDTGEKSETKAQTVNKVDNLVPGAPSTQMPISTNATAEEISARATRVARSNAEATREARQAQPTRTPRPSTPTPVVYKGLGVSRFEVQLDMAEIGYSIDTSHLDEFYVVYGDSADDTSSMSLFVDGNSNYVDSATLQFYYSPALDLGNVLLSIVVFTNSVLPDWKNSNEWLAGAFSKVADGELAEKTVSTANGEAYVVLEIIGDDTISLEIRSEFAKSISDMVDKMLTAE